MKKIFLTTILFLAVVASYGEQPNSSEYDYVVKEQTIEMYDFNDFDSTIDETLNLTDEQKNKVVEIIKKFDKDMHKAYESKDRKEKTLRSIYQNVNRMKKTLSKEQYSQYLKLFNIEINRRGIDIL